MKAFIAAGLAAMSLAAYAGEDSTHRWGTGTGPNYWDTPCGLLGFARATTDKPCTQRLAAEMSVEEMRAWIAQHATLMDEMMARMNSEHRAMMGGSANARGGGSGAAR